MNNLRFIIKTSIRKRIVYYTLYSIIIKIRINILNFFYLWYYKIFKFSKIFIVNGKTYKYFYHKYNKTWTNPRAIEIPIIWEIVKKSDSKYILEVGNVLSHYFKVNYDILDKYEKGAGVLNKDIIDFHPSKKYKLIVSISTLEHIGWDEILGKVNKNPNPMKILRAIENLKSILVSKGKMVITLPMGYNPGLDRLLRNNKIDFSKRYCLKRITKDNQWKEVKWNDISHLKFGIPFPPYANGILIGVIEKS